MKLNSNQNRRNPMNSSILLSGFFLWVASQFASPVMATDDASAARVPRVVALVGATVHPVSSEPIAKATIIFENGKITALGSQVAIPAAAEVVDLAGKHIYPALFESYSQMGLTEIGAVPATIDTSESGEINPNVSALVAVNPDSELIPVTRSNGVLIAVSAPSGGLVSGMSAVLQLEGWTYEDLSLKDKAAMHVNWPSLRRGRFSRSDDQDESQLLRRYEEQVDRLRDLFEETRAYQAGKQAHGDEQPLDLRLEAMMGIVNGELPMMVQADSLNQIQSAVAFAAEQQVKLIIMGGYDAPLCAELLKKHEVPVILSAVQRRPLRRNDAYDTPYTLAARLSAAGVKFAISASDRSSTWNTRILPFQAAVAAGYGLDRMEALKAITLYPAEIFGVDQQVGSLQVGKDATLFVCDSDPLDIDNQVTHAWVQGRPVDLSDKHKRLYEKYQRKYQQLRKEIVP